LLLTGGMRSLTWSLIVVATACGGNTNADVDAPAESDAADPDAATPDGPPATVLPTGTVTGITDLGVCPQNAPAGARCKRVTVEGCAGIEAEPITAIVAIRNSGPVGTTPKGTVVHFAGGGGQGFQGGGQGYELQGYRGVYVSWATDWEQTQSLGIKAAACRPATILKWIFDEPTLHAGSRAQAFCGEGFSGGSGQLGYALAHYGLGDFLDYVNELSGPPFARIDLGCDGDAPATSVVCGTNATMRLPRLLDSWENIPAPLQCGSTGVPADELARWKADSIAFGGAYFHPQTQVRFFACTNQPTAVTAMGALYYDVIAQASGTDPERAQFNCYSDADGCQGENLGAGNRDAVDALIAGCIPRHM
jgi:hypothetical protein